MTALFEAKEISVDRVNRQPWADMHLRPVTTSNGARHTSD